jgi:hypothetical protein
VLVTPIDEEGNCWPRVSLPNRAAWREVLVLPFCVSCSAAQTVSLETLRLRKVNRRPLAFVVLKHWKVDIPVAADFPRADYMEVERRIAAYVGRLGVNPATAARFAGFAGGWNGLVMRFRAADEEGLFASTSLARFQGDLSAEDRYLQERALFGFFANAVSAVESCCFSIYHLGQMRQPTAFTEPDCGVTVGVTAAAVATAFRGTPLNTELSNLSGDGNWLSLKKIRNTLVHRESPGITIFIGAAGTPPRPAEWTDRGVVLEPALVDDPRAWLGAAITRLVGVTLTFVSGSF